MRRSLPALLGMMILLAAAAPAHAVTVQQWNTPSKFINRKDEFPRDLTNGHLVTNVILPTGYKSRKCWPVMYLLHGTASWPTDPPATEWLRVDGGAILKMNIPAILVVPGGGEMWWVDNWWKGLRHPGYESWVLREVIPLVAKRLHVCPGRSQHSIAGLSMGGYGAIYLASQRPDYFGTAGSFSGVLSPESPNFLKIFPTFPTYWGPAGKFYAVGHDPLALVDNLRHTRVFVGAGNGVALPGEINTLTAQFEESEFDQESLSFTSVARRAGVSVHFDQHAGTHSDQNWITSLTDMLAWKPFTRATTPSRWTFSTIESAGTAWGYQFAFPRYSPPRQIAQLSLSNGVFEARGAGMLKVTPPHGRAVTARLPFAIRHGVAVRLKHAPAPHPVGGYNPIKPVLVTATPKHPAAADPITVSFRAPQNLPGDQVYQVGILSLSTTCVDTVRTRISAAKGKLVTVVLLPGGDPAHPQTTWCPGPAALGVSVIEKATPITSFAIGNLLGYALLTFP